MKKNDEKVTTTRVGQIVLESLSGIILILLLIPIILAIGVLSIGASPVFQEVFTIILYAFIGLETLWSSVYIYTLYRVRNPQKAAQKSSSEK